MRRHFVRFLAAAAVLSAAAAPGAAQPKPEAPRLVAHTGQRAIFCVAFSPDGKRVLTGSVDNTACLWDADTGKNLRAFAGHTSIVKAVAFAPDGKRVLTGSWDKTVCLWDADTGNKLRTFKGHSGGLFSVGFSPDGKLVLTGGEDKTARLWDAESAKELRKFEGHTGGVHSAAFSPDGKRVLTASADNTARLWDTATGKELRKFEGHSDAVTSAAFSPDGRRVLTGSADKTARLWDADGGKSLLSFKGHSATVGSVAFSPDGKRVLSGSADKTARLWDAESAKELRAFRGHGYAVKAVFSPDGARVLTGGRDGTACLWDGATGKELRRFTGESSLVDVVAFSHDGKRLLTWAAQVHVWDGETGKELRYFAEHTRAPTMALAPDGKCVVVAGLDKNAVLWDADAGKQVRAFTGHSANVQAVAFSADGKRVLTGSADKTARLWDAGTGKELRRFSGHTGSVLAAAFSPDGKRLLTGSADKTARLWDADSGKELHKFEGHPFGPVSVAFSPDGKRVLTGGGDWAARLWDADTGAQLGVFRGHSYQVHAAAFSPDGKWVLTGSGDQTARLWNAGTGKELRRFTGHTGDVKSVAFSPNGKRVLTGSTDQTARLWDTETGKELCRLISFRDGSWAVVDGKGRYDASKGGDIEGLHWVVGNEIIALDQLKERYYDPGLLAKHLGLSDEKLRDVAAFDDVKLFPIVAVAQKDPKKPVLDVSLTNRGGGIGKVVVLVNGKEKMDDARPRGATDEKADKLRIAVNLANDPRVVPGQRNTVEVVAYNADGSLASRGMVREFDDPGTVSTEKPRLYAVVAGVSKYRGDKLNLRFAAKDADAFATALELAADRLFDADKVHVTRLTGATEASRPTRAGLDKALAALKQTKAGDVVVVYLAGHGVTQGGQQDSEWYYLSADAQPADLSDPAVLKRVSVSSADLTNLLKATPAQKQVLILDTCHSGRVVEKLTEKRDVPGSQVRALERVKDRTGMFVLAGCAADSVSYEATRYGQGLLTYSLLLGMKGAKLREGEYVDVADLFGFAADKVPELARDIGGVQRPLIASPKGAPFDIGRLTEADRKKVPLQTTVKPLVLRSNFQDEDRLLDGLNLAGRVDARLREASAGARGAQLVFVDAVDFPGGVRVAGRYKVKGDTVTAGVTLFDGEKKIDSFTVTGAAKQPDDLAQKIAAEIGKRLATIPTK